jgi:hypothetical protein
MRGYNERTTIDESIRSHARCDVTDGCECRHPQPLRRRADAGFEHRVDVRRSVTLKYRFIE